MPLQLASETAWHNLSSEETLDKLNGTVEGLTPTQADERLQQYGPNRLPEGAHRSPLLRFLSHFHNLLIYVLLCAALITAALGHWVDTGVIIGVVLLNAIIGYAQEGKAENALAAIRDMLSPQAMVLRENHRIMLNADLLVPGDIVLLQAGDKVPADLRLLQAKNLLIQEAVLTGESIPINKQIDLVPLDATLGDRTCCAYSGTLVNAGHGIGVVVATGHQTEIGQISALISQVTTLTTPLIQSMAVFARWLTLAVLVIAALVFAFGVGVLVSSLVTFGLNRIYTFRGS